MTSIEVVTVIGAAAGIYAAVFAHRSFSLQRRLGNGISVSLVLTREGPDLLRAHAYFETHLTTRSQLKEIRVLRPHGARLKFEGDLQSSAFLAPANSFVNPHRTDNAAQFFVLLPPGARGVVRVEVRLERSSESDARRLLSLRTERMIP